MFSYVFIKTSYNTSLALKIGRFQLEFGYKGSNSFLKTGFTKEYTTGKIWFAVFFNEA